MSEEPSFNMILEKHDPKLPTKKSWVVANKENLLLNVYLEFRNTSSNFLSSNCMVVNCICNTFQQKAYSENLQTMKIMLLKALCDEDFGRKFQQMSSSSDLHIIRLETQVKTLTYCWWKASWDKRCSKNYFIIKCISKAVSTWSA